MEQSLLTPLERGNVTRKFSVTLMGRPPLNPTGPMTAAERQARRRKRAGKSINRRRRTLYKIANESETKKKKRARRVEILAEIAERTQAASAALGSARMPLCNLVYLDPPVAARQLFGRDRIGSLDRQHLCADDLEGA
jgi:hypothetical protein